MSFTYYAHVVILSITSKAPYVNALAQHLFDMPNCNVAAVAQQRSNFASVVAVVNHQHVVMMVMRDLLPLLPWWQRKPLLVAVNKAAARHSALVALLLQQLGISLLRDPVFLEVLL